MAKKEKKINTEISTGLMNISKDIKILKERLLELEKENRQLRSSLFNATSDNKRLQMISQREKEQESGSTLKRVAGHFMPVIDDLEQAKKMLLDTGIDPAHIKPIEFILESLDKAMKNIGLESFEPIGKEFDPHTCQLGGKMPTNEYEEDVICKVIRKGYRIAEDTIRPAIVICAQEKNISDNTESQK